MKSRRQIRWERQLRRTTYEQAAREHIRENLHCYNERTIGLKLLSLSHAAARVCASHTWKAYTAASTDKGYAYMDSARFYAAVSELANRLAWTAFGRVSK
jgi:hypothetical protein